MQNQAVIRPKKKVGRAFNHLEDLVFLYGSTGALEALQHLAEFNTLDGACSIRKKVDGSPQLYWGRENGKFVPPHTHNQWEQRVVPYSSADVDAFIMRTGKEVTNADIELRQQFASKVAKQAALFEQSVPDTLHGRSTFYVYADALYLNTPNAASGIFSVSPNIHSKSAYHIKESSTLGKRVNKSKSLVIGHASFAAHGQADDMQLPLDDFTLFDSDDVIVHNPIINRTAVKVGERQLSVLQQYITQHAACIDTFLAGCVGLTDIKRIIYTYVNHSVRHRVLNMMGTAHFMTWANSGAITASKTSKITELNKHNALDIIFKIVKAIQLIKDSVILQLEFEQPADIWDTDGEGHVRYADSTKQFGHIKLVPRKRWTPK